MALPDDTPDISEALLGVARSATGRSWRLRAADEATVTGHRRRLDLPEPLARALAARGVAVEDGPDYLSPTLKALFPDPSTFADMDKAAVALVDALDAGRKVVVFADYDVDGATSAALLVRWFRAMGQELEFYVPDRVTEGYGPSAAAFRTLKDLGTELVVTVDCGAAAHEAVAAATGMGLEVVVIDHHLMRGGPPDCVAVVNPNRPDCGSGQGMLAAAGVTFVLLAALNREVRRRRPEAVLPDPRSWLDLAALGAICDVTALTGFNRALASQGLKVMSHWANPGLSALMEVASARKEAATGYHAGFVLGPRINAGGRIGRADLGARLLSTDDPAEALALARELDALNTARREVEREVTEAAIAQVERASNFDPEAPIVVVAGEGWHPGVVGIVAGRLRERWRRPVIVVGTEAATGLGKGSGRSQPGVNLGQAVQAAFEAGLLLSGGGHAMAAGLTVRTDTLPELREFLADRLMAAVGDACAADAVEVDAVISVAAADRGLCLAFERLAPFGPGAPEPFFALTGVVARDATAMNGGHVRCRLVGPDGKGIKAIAWRCADTPLGEALLGAGGALHVVGKLKRDDWNSRESVQFEIEDAAHSRRST